MAKVKFEGRSIAQSKVATNSLVLAGGDLVAQTSGFIVKATAGTEILGISKTTKTFASDNQTVAKAKAVYLPKDQDLILEIGTSATITQADVGSFFSITAGQLADVATKSVNKMVVNTSDAGSTTDPVIASQLKLEVFVSANLGYFSLV